MLSYTGLTDRHKKGVYDLLCAVFLSKRMQCESRDLENPSTVHVAVCTRQITMWLKHRLV